MKTSLVSTGISGLLSLAAFAVASPSYAASIDLSSFGSIGDATTTTNTATLNSGTLNTAFTGGGGGSVEDFLGITPASLSSAIPNNTFGSAIKKTFTGINAGDVFSFNWNLSGSDAARDKAFVTIGNSVTLLSGGSPFSYSFSAAGNYDIGIGIVDVVDSIGQSTLSVSNANLQPVPEPATILGSMTALGFGINMVRRRKKSGV